MDLYPAIDIRHGRVVRLSQGEATRQTVYGEDPAAVAEIFVRGGARWAFIEGWSVDLSRAQRLSGPAASNWTLGAIWQFAR